MRKIITEINRIREMIGVSLIVEGIGDVLNIFTNLGKKSIKERFCRNTKSRYKKY